MSINKSSDNKKNTSSLVDLSQSAHMKHISEISQEDQRRAKEILQEIRDVFSNIIGLSKNETKNRLKNFGRLKSEVEKLGYVITADFLISNVHGELTVTSDLRLYTSKCKMQIVN